MRDAFGHEAAGRNEPEEANDGMDGKTNQEKWIHRDKLAKIENSTRQPFSSSDG
jgi:hypothetical protein